MTKLVTFAFAVSLLIGFSCSPSSDNQSLDQSIVKEISDLFVARDKSVLDNNLNDFLKTQLDNQDFYGGSAEGYISTSGMTTHILKTMAVESKLPRGLNADYVVLVKEDYEHDNKYSHSGFILYYLANTSAGLRITDTEVSWWHERASEEKQQED